MSRERPRRSVAVLAVAAAAVVALAALACVSMQLGAGSRARLLQMSLPPPPGAAGPSAAARRHGATRPQLARAVVGSLAQGIRRVVKQVEHDGSALDEGTGGGELPSMRQVLQTRHLRSAERARARRHYRERLRSRAAEHVVDCNGKSAASCGLSLDAEALEHVFKARPQELLQLSRFDSSAKDLQRRMGGAAAQSGSTSLKTLEKQEADLRRQNRLERQINTLLINNKRLAKQNAQLQAAKAATVREHGGHRGRVPRTQEQFHPYHLDQSDQGNPAGIAEQVPATVSAPPMGVPDFNGATAVVARLPQGLGFGPSVLDAQGVEERGSFTLHKSNPYAETSIRVYGKMNHPIKCTLKSYRKLGGMFRGQTVYTGYKKIWTGKSSITTGIIPPASSGRRTFDVMTCRDMQTGEVQHFRTIPSAPFDPDDGEGDDGHPA